jgi:hypothetical protein
VATIPLSFKQLKKIVDTLLAELENDAEKNGVDIGSSRFLEIADTVKRNILKELGIGYDDYVLAEAKLDSGKPISEIDIPHIPTKEEIVRIAESVIPAPQIFNEIVEKREVIREKPIIKHVRVDEKDSSNILELENRVMDLEEQAKKPSVVKNFVKNITKTEKKSDFTSEEIKNLKVISSKNWLRESTKIFEMELFRKLGMGLQGQIDELRTSINTENLWDRTGTVLSPHNAGDSVYINTNSATALKVEQDGVKDDVFIVDTTNKRVGVGIAPTNGMFETGGDAGSDRINYFAGTSTHYRPIIFNPTCNWTNDSASNFAAHAFTAVIQPQDAITKNIWNFLTNVQVSNSSFNITQLYGYSSNLQLMDTYSGTVANATMFNIANPTLGAGGASITTLIGLNIANMSVGSTNYSIYTGTGIHRWGGQFLMANGLFYPTVNSTTAFQFDKADGTTNVVNIDTTNSRVGIGTTSPAAKLEIEAATASDIGLILQTTDDSATNPIFQVRSSTGTILSGISGLDGHIAVGVSPSSLYRMYTGGTSATATTGFWVTLISTSPSTTINGIGATITAGASETAMRGIYASARTSAAAITVTNAYSIYIDSGVLGSGSAITTQTGLYIEDQLLGTNNYAIRGNAGLYVFNEGGDSTSDFRIEGDTNANLFFLDASEDKIAIGYTSPIARFDVANTTGGVLALTRNDTSVTANDLIGAVAFHTNDTQTTTTSYAASIEVYANSTIASDINPGYMIFKTTPTGVGASLTEVFRLTAGQDIQIAEGNDIILGTTTGTKIGTATTQKLGFYNVTPIVQPSAYTQTYSTADKTHANFTSADLGAFTGGAVGFVDAAERDNIRTQFNALRVDVADVKQLVNSLIDDLQALGLTS